MKIIKNFINSSPHDSPVSDIGSILGSALKRYLRATPCERKLKRVNIYKRPVIRYRSRRWNSIQKSDSRFIVVQRGETYLLNLDDQSISRSIYRNGRHDSHKLEKALNLLGRSQVETIVDVGANLGEISIVAVKRGLAKRAIAIEPDPLNFKILQTNVLLNNLVQEVHCHQVAVGAISGGSLKLKLSSTNFGDHQISSSNIDPKNSDRTVNVNVHLLDELAPNLTRNKDLLWMDIQGYEFHALLGAKAALRSRVPIVMELSPSHLKQHCLFNELVVLLEHYEGFWDLTEYQPKKKSMDQLMNLITTLDDGVSETDVLII